MAAVKIGINATFLNDQPTGLGVFTREVCRAMQDIHPELIVFSPVAIEGIPPERLVKVPYAVRGSKRLFNNMLRLGYINSALNRHCRKRHIDVLYTPMLELPFYPVIPQVATVHDLHPLMFPEQFGLSSYYFRLSLKLLGRLAARVTVVSSYIKKEIAAKTGYPQDKIDVTLNGYNKDLFRPADPGERQALMNKYGIRGRYLLFVGNLFPYKNVQLLTDAYNRMAERSDVELVISGIKEYANSALPRAEGIHYLGYVPSGDLPKLYSYASLLVHPSLSEGFGFTPLEAMACGCPVLASDRTSIPEVVGRAAILFDPADAGNLSRLIKDTLGNPALLEELRTKGFRQAKKFSWQQTAAGVIESCRKALEASA